MGDHVAATTVPPSPNRCRLEGSPRLRDDGRRRDPDRFGRFAAPRLGRQSVAVCHQFGQGSEGAGGPGDALQDPALTVAARNLIGLGGLRWLRLTETPRGRRVRAPNKLSSMAVSRVLVRCHICSHRLVLRISVSGGMQPFLFGCPYCATAMHGSLFAEVGKVFELRSEDFDLVDGHDEQPEELAVAINTDIPVHRSFVGQPAAETSVTPFIALVGALGTDVAGELMPRIETLRALRERVFPHVRRAAGHFIRGDIASVEATLARMPSGDRIDFSKLGPVDVLRNALRSRAEVNAAVCCFPRSMAGWSM